MVTGRLFCVMVEFDRMQKFRFQSETLTFQVILAFLPNVIVTFSKLEPCSPYTPSYIIMIILHRRRSRRIRRLDRQPQDQPFGFTAMVIRLTQIMDFASRQVQSLNERRQANQDDPRNQNCSVRVGVDGREE